MVDDHRHNVTEAIAEAIRKARELSSTLNELDRLGVDYDLEVHTVPIGDRKPLRQVMVLVKQLRGSVGSVDASTH